MKKMAYEVSPTGESCFLINKHVLWLIVILYYILWIFFYHDIMTKPVIKVCKYSTNRVWCNQFFLIQQNIFWFNLMWSLLFHLGHKETDISNLQHHPSPDTWRMLYNQYIATNHRQLLSLLSTPLNNPCMMDVLDLEENKELCSDFTCSNPKHNQIRKKYF